MKNLLSPVVIGLLLLATVVVPPVGTVAFGASSMAAGALLVSGLYVFLFVVLGPIAKPSYSLGNSVFFIVTALVVVFSHGVLGLLINDRFDFSRFWQSYALLIIYISGAYSLASLVKRLSQCEFNLAVKLVFYALLLTGFAGILGYSSFFNDKFARSVVFFPEPSHFALSFLPFLLYMMVFSGSVMKLFFLSMSFLMAFFLENFTLFVGATIIALCTISLRRLVILVPIAAMLWSTVDVNIDYYTARTDFSQENQNLSVLAYSQGWERAYLNFKDSFGLGVGYQQFGIVGSRGSIQEDLAILGVADMNLLDGSAVAPKFIGEFGVLAVAALLVYLVYFAKRAIWLRGVSMSRAVSNDPREIFFLACFVTFFVDLFIRGTGYFSSTGFLFVASLVWMAFRKHRLTGAVHEHFVQMTVGGD